MSGGMDRERGEPTAEELELSRLKTENKDLRDWLSLIQRRFTIVSAVARSGDAEALKLAHEDLRDAVRGKR